jgi:hypothetical protein
MSETVLVALVTFLSGAVGAAVGAWGVIKSSERASKGQMQQAIMQEFFRTRVSAYQAVFETQISMSAAQYSAESVAAFVTALNAACVVASPQTALYLMELRTAEATKNVADCRKVLPAMLASMQKDLTTFDEPEIRKNLWSQDTAKAAKTDKTKPNGV